MSTLEKFDYEFKQNKSVWQKYRGRFLTKGSAPPEFHQPIPRVSNGYVVCSFVSAIKWGSKKIDGNVLEVTGFGKIYFGEVLINEYSRRFTLVRLAMGSDVRADVALGEGDSNGSCDALMLRSSSLGIVLVSGVLVVSGSRQPDRASPEEGYQLALAKFRQGALDESLAQVRRAGALWRSRSGTEWHWTFRLLEAEVLLEQAELTGAQNLLENDLGDCRKYARAEIRRRTCFWQSCVHAAADLIPAGFRLCWRRLAPWLAARRLQDFAQRSMCTAVNWSFAGTISIRRNVHGEQRNSLPNTPAMNISMPRPPTTWA